MYTPFENAEFTLLVNGNGMSPTFIDADTVFCCNADSVPDGEVAVVALGDMHTIRRVFRTADGFMLENDSCTYPPMYLSRDECRIIGRPIGIHRAIA